MVSQFTQRLALLLLKARIVSPLPSEVKLSGVRVPLCGSDLPRWTRRALLMGIYEQPERRFVESYVRPGEQVLELGASIGVVSSIISKRIGSSGKLVSVEANSALAQRFQKQLSINAVEADLVNCLACPIWANQPPGSVTGKGFFASSDPLKSKAAANVANQSVVWRTASQICEAEALDPSALVVDIEGAEEVWAECSPNCPTSLRTIIIELHPGIVGGDRIAMSINALFAEGFRLSDYNGDVYVFTR
jgi:FkbM family methyltransferase